MQRPWGRNGPGLFKGSKKEAGAYCSNDKKREREAEESRGVTAASGLPRARSWGKLYIICVYGPASVPSDQKPENSIRQRLNMISILTQSHKDLVFMDSTTRCCPETQPTSLLPGH